MNTVEAGLAMLGYNGTDKVTGMEGVVTSVGFDLYGCVQGGVGPWHGQGRQAQGELLAGRQAHRSERCACDGAAEFHDHSGQEGKWCGRETNTFNLN